MTAPRIPNIKISRIRDLITMDPDRGSLTWRPRPVSDFSCERVCKTWHTKYCGNPALTNVTVSGYYRGRIDYVDLFAHRVVWAMQYGEWPDGQIDHINGDGLDNRIANLRTVGFHENSRNKMISSRNKSGKSGVDYVKRDGRWRARISDGSKNIHLGYFETLDEAIAARSAAERALGYHVNHGRSLSVP